MVVRLIKFNAWIAFACGIFCLLVAGLIVDQTLMSLGLKAQQILRQETYLAAVSFVRVIGVLLFAYAMAVRYVLAHGFAADKLRAFFGLFAIGVVLWTGMLIFLVFTKSVLLAAIAAFGLLEWLLVAVALLFEHKKPQSWQAVRPGDE
jgi:hypothetical protein